MARRHTVAVVGGHRKDLARHERRFPNSRVRHFPSRRNAGVGSQRSLCDALRGGGIDSVVILTRFVGHSQTTKLRARCKALGVPVEMSRG
jgi:hypothetical protein